MPKPATSTPPAALPPCAPGPPPARRGRFQAFTRTMWVLFWVRAAGSGTIRGRGER
ncbi:MAG: hypothetical protein WKG07_21235 [Hymenobacter sp.]